MKALKLTPRDSRIAAVGLLLLALLLAYFLLLHWWFVAPLRDIDAQMDDLRDTQSRYAAAIAEKPLLEKSLAALGAGQAASDAYLPDDDPNTAAADLMQRVVDAVAGHTEGGSCKVTQKMPVTNPQSAPDEPYRKAAASINLSCDIQPLVAVLQSLEQGTPYLFVDNLNIYRNPIAVQGNGLPLEVQFTVSGYVRPGNGGATAPSSPAAGQPGESP
ncbi:type II secretion system protein M [Rhodanobacter sp. 7MK24]|uniref:type II secretion system protein GspM n=1 Tax=Rhodanobacter sp. 7MK24 TaxID=2775922 RepID=UPI00177F92D9|nr:type II secretion system protein GspM [Rhodanobacter sp. 7MK24]MBD8881841.1 type II secretion system protein M [Rhodanobacter sp. 7MK24]